MAKVPTVARQEEPVLAAARAIAAEDVRSTPPSRFTGGPRVFRVLAKIGLLEVVKTETFPAEPVEIFVKALA